MTILFIFQRPVLIFFGAKDKQVLELILKYTNWLKIGLPFFFMSQVLSVFVRNDNNPIRASIAVIGGGILNSVLDFTFVFGLKMGINGAGLATFLGQVFTVIILLTHFMSKKNSLRIVKPVTLFKDIKEIVLNGVSSFILDICMGVITIVFNNQIYKYSVDDPSKYLAIYGVIINIQTLIQSLGYAVGQASQPLLSESAGKGDEISLKKYHKYSIYSSIIIGAILLLITELLAPTLLHIFAKVSYDSDIMILGKDITRLYFVSFVFVVFNVYSIYYFNSILKKNVSFVISILRGFILPLIFMFTLPLINITMLFASLIFVEGSIMLINIYLMKFNKISLN
jgi:Na+-driven multidrug efflux pump